QIPFAHDVVAAYYCAMDPEVPMRVRATLVGALAYFVAPIDGIPDFLLGIGFGDDATVLAAAIAMVATHINEKHRAKARAALQD
ncbi:MAG: YkvA family protein, partial [Pseudomonadota bacterium]